MPEAKEPTDLSDATLSYDPEGPQKMPLLLTSEGGLISRALWLAKDKKINICTDPNIDRQAPDAHRKRDKL